MGFVLKVVGMKLLSERDENYVYLLLGYHFLFCVGMKLLSERDENIHAVQNHKKHHKKSRNEATL